MKINVDEDTIPLPYPGISRVRPEWEDANGHMNMAHYVSAFDDGSSISILSHVDTLNAKISCAR